MAVKFAPILAATLGVVVATSIETKTAGVAVKFVVPVCPE